MIRKATVKDVTNLVRIEKKVFTQSLGESFLYDELLLNPFAHYFVFELNREVVGYIGYRAIDANAEMMNFCFFPEYQGQGFGTELLTYSIEFLKGLGVNQLLLEVRKSNCQARAIYEKLGFKKSHVRKNYYQTEDAYVYMKEV